VGMVDVIAAALVVEVGRLGVVTIGGGAVRL
jgi:hypothetical protein